jgi:hypothetical protein
MAQATAEDLEKALIRWEAAVSEVERYGDDSDEAALELADSRSALLDILVQAKVDIDMHQCTRPAPHVCKVNGPCNGYPKET